MSFQAQFVTAMFWVAQSLYIGCKFTRWMQYNLIFYGGTILALFLNFYYHAYIKTIKKQVRFKSSFNATDVQSESGRDGSFVLPKNVSCFGNNCDLSFLR